MTKEDGKQPKAGVYLLPNLFTTAGLFAGFYAVVSAMKGHFDIAAIAIFIAMITDSLDGRIARLTNTQSPFGAQFDSLADMVSFGVAPALVVYSWSLFSLGKFGWLSAFLYTATGALRLARFNIQIEVVDKKHFKGLAIPSAAGVIASMVWLGNKYDVSPEMINIYVAVVTVMVSVLMVSNIRYYSFKEIDFKGKVPYFSVLLVLSIFVGISINPPLVLFVVWSLYAASGPVTALFKLRRKEK